MKTQTRTTGRRIGGGVLLVLLGLLAAAPAVAVESEFDYGAVGLRIAVWVDRAEDEIYRKGDSQAVGFQASEDAYAVVYRIDTEGEVTVLWPRSRLDDGFIFGGHEYELPVSGGRQLRVSSREGEGFVEAIVSRYPFDLRGLEVDFHHEPNAERLGYRVAGDPFLAMNEVNFAVTGMEDAEDYVVTNYVSYYVHQEVDHPRYLCSQCHFEDDTAYDPYGDTCQLDITVDYRWGNTWWDSYGYYPVYASPVYVYVDPWTWRPWVNFWYDPWWRCPPVRGCGWTSSIYVWHDSSWYRGNCNVRYRDGHGVFRPLTPYDAPRAKVREYGVAAPMVAAGREKKNGSAGRSRGYEGVPRTRRDNPAIVRTASTRGNGGLRIRDGHVNGAPTAGVRHASGGTRAAADLKSTPRTGAGQRKIRSDRAGVGDRGTDAVRTRSGGGLRTVEPRNKGTRIWSLDRGGSVQQRQDRSRQIRPGGSRSSGRGTSATQRTGDSQRTKGSQRTKSTPQTKGGRTTSGRKSPTVRTKSGGRSGGTRDSGKAKVRSKSKSGGGGDSSTKSSSSGGSSTRSSSGGSSGGSSKATRSGGSSSRGSGGSRGGKRR